MPEEVGEASEAGIDAIDDVWLTGAVVVRGPLPALRQLFADVRKRGELKVVYVRASAGRLRISDEELR